MNAIKSKILPIILATSLASCGAFKPSAKLASANADTNNQSTTGTRFLNVKAVEHGKMSTRQASNTTENAVASTQKQIIKPKGSNTVDNSNYSAIQIKYAEKLGVSPEEIKNTKLYQAIEDWYGTRYRFGGTTKRGVDCSSLMQHLYKATYGLSIPRTAVTQYGATQRVLQDDLQEGDLVFFHTTRAGISHVGFYLGNRKFIHASSSRGVVISSLDESYYVPRYRGGGRFKKGYSHDGEEIGEDQEMDGTK